MQGYDSIRSLAMERGFDCVSVIPAGDVPDLMAQWKLDAKARGTEHGLSDDPRKVLPWCESILLLSYPYSLIEEYPPDCAWISGYYFASQRAHIASNELAGALCDLGFRVERNSPLPLKPLAAACGHGVYGQNNVIVRSEGLLLLQAIALDRPYERTPAHAVRNLCEESRCGEGDALCVGNCPAGALRDGKIDTSRCIRAHMISGTPVPLALREKMDLRLIGCDECTRPHNSGSMPLPEGYRELFHLEALLDPERLKKNLPAIADAVGANYANANRLLAQAILAAANSTNPKRYSSRIQALCAHPSETVAEHAAWAMAKIKNSGGV